MKLHLEFSVSLYRRKTNWRESAEGVPKMFRSVLLQRELESTEVTFFFFLTWIREGKGRIIVLFFTCLTVSNKDRIRLQSKRTGGKCS